MKRVILIISMVIMSLMIKAQVPHGINYQGIARNGTVPITTIIPVRITIQSDSLGGSLYWVEEHSSIKPNESGLFSLVVGTGKKISGVSSFGDIDWSSGQKYIKTEINYDGWITMGSSRIWSVPYSLVAKGLGGPVDKLGVQGKTSSLEEALFEVKNKDGQTVFAVYNEGVRVNVSDGDAKGAKGGFAIGGFDLTKGTTRDLFVVNSDSIRAYIYDDPLTKGAKGGFAIGGFDLTKGTTNDYLLISPDSARIYIDNTPSTKGAKGGFAIGGFDLTKGINQKFLTVSNDSIRMYIDDGVKGAKGGFAIGGFDLTKGLNQKFMTVSNDSIRMYIDDQGKGAKGGFAIGGFDLTKGDRASFLNVATDASGIINPSQNRILWYPIKNAFLTGKVFIQDPDSVGENSFASGYESRALGDYSQALGFNIIARGNYSTAIGKNATANAENSVSIGNHSRADKSSSFAFGTGAIALGVNSYAIGSSGVDSAGFPTGNTMSIGDQSFAIGMGARSNGLGSFSFGTQCIADEDFSFAGGYQSISNGYSSIALGYKNEVSDDYSISIGSFSKAEKGGLSLGYLSNASGRESASLNWSEALGDYSVALGGGVLWGYLGSYPIGLPLGARAVGTGSVAIGFGAKASGKWSYAIGFGDVYWGQSTSSAEGTESIGKFSYAIGNFVKSYGDNSVAMGHYTTAMAYNSFVLGQYNVISGDSTSWIPTDPLFVIGKGSSASARSNAFTVLKNGYTAIGHASPSQMLDVNGNARIRSIGSGAYYSVVNRMSDGTLTAATSDISFKENINTINNSLNSVLNLRGVTFTWKTEPEMGRRIGFIAQEVEKVIPELVFTNPEDGFKGVNYAEMSAVLVEAVKEQQQQIESQQKEINELKALVNTLIANQ